MLYFLFGEDTYSSTRKVREIEQMFVKEQNSDFNVSKLAGEDLAAGTYFGAVMALPFLGNKRLIIIRNLLRDNGDKGLKQEIAKSLEKIPKENLLIFLEEGKPDRRESIFKTLVQKAQTKEYPLPDTRSLLDWIMKKAEDFGGQIDRNCASKLALFVGPDLWRLENEISKLVLTARAKETKISVSDIEGQVESINNFQIFDLTDAVAARNIDESLLVYLKFQRDGLDSLMVINMIIYQYRNMLVISDLLESGCPSSALAAKTKIHPFVIQKVLSSLRAFDKADLWRNYIRLAEFDWQIKSGQFDPSIAVFKLLVDFCRK